jgi:hypothetical protein
MEQAGRTLDGIRGVAQGFLAFDNGCAFTAPTLRRLAYGTELATSRANKRRTPDGIMPRTQFDVLRNLLQRIRAARLKAWKTHYTTAKASLSTRQTNR